MSPTACATSNASGLLTSLLPYQGAAADKLTPLRVGALFMDMGTGKSRTAIEIADRRRRRVSRVLWFCPVNLKETVRREIVKHVPSPAIRVFDDRTTQRNVDRDAFWHVIGIESMSQSRRTVLAAASLVDENAMVIVDESSYIKGHRAARTKWITEIGRRARYRLLLTGTPISQGIVDLYAQMFFLSPDILGYPSFYSFAANHLEYSDKYPGKIVRAHNTGYIAAKIAPYVYQVTKEECLDLPAKLYESRYFAMTGPQRKLYETAQETILSEIDEWQDDAYDSTIVYRLFVALQQVACGFWKQRFPKRWLGRPQNLEPVLHTVPHCRLDTLVETIGEIPEGEKVIVWAKYRTCIEEIAARLEAEFGQPAAKFYGDLSLRERDRQLSRFRADARFLVATETCGGHGLTVNEAAYTVFYTNGFNWAARAQAEDRNHRIGQTRRVTYLDVACLGTIDMRIEESLRDKGNVVADFKQKVERIRDKRALKDALREMVSVEDRP